MLKKYKSKILWILVIALMLLLSTTVYAVNTTYELGDITKGLLLDTAGTRLLEKTFGVGSLDLTSENAEKYMFCAQEYNSNLTKRNSSGVEINHYWRAELILDFNAKDSNHTSPTYGRGLRSNSDTNASKKVYAKFAAYAYYQNRYGIDGYLSKDWKTTLKNLIAELKQSGNNTIIANYEKEEKKTSTGLIGISSPTVNKSFSNALSHYATFASSFEKNKGDLFDYTKSSGLAIRSDNTMGPYDVNLASGCAKVTDTVSHRGENKTTKITTGVSVNKIVLKMKNGTTLNITNASGDKYKIVNSSGTQINFNTNKWTASFYIKGDNLEQIESIKLNYSYNLYFARYLILSGKSGVVNYYSAQGYATFEGGVKNYNKNLDLPVVSKVYNGIIKITKQDSTDSSKKIEGAKFQILKANGSKYTVVKTITTNSSGYATTSVPLGSIYYIKEIKGTNTNYDYNKVSIKSSSGNTSMVTLNGSRAVKIGGFASNSTRDITLTLVLTNPPTDKTPPPPPSGTGIFKRCSQTGRGVEGATFSLYQTKSHNNSTISYGSYTTNSNGEINLGGIPWTYIYYTYEDYYVDYWYTVDIDTDGDGVSDDYYWDYDRVWYVRTITNIGYYSYTAYETSTNKRYIYSSQSVGITEGSVSTVDNTPKYLTIRGYVFKDIPQGKEGEVDGLYSGGDELFSGITVELYNGDTNRQISSTTTNGSGQYQFSYLNQFVNYYVKFRYDGQEYMATYYNVGDSSNYGSNSLATESQSEREEFNNRFSVISSANVNSSKLMNAYTGADGSDDIYMYNVDNESELGGLISFGSNTIIIDNINFGLVERPKADLALEKDVYSATIRIKGYEQTYNYNTRRLDTDFETWEIKDRLDIADYYSKVYNREIYASDYAYKCELYNNRGLSINTDTELKVFITYIMKVKNSSQSIVGGINEIVDYYDSDYTFVPEMSYANVNNSQVDLDTNSKSSYSSNNSLTGFNNLYINGLEEFKLTSGDYLNLYLTFEVNKDNAKNILIDQNLQNMQISTGKENFAEINAYSTFYGENTYLPNVDEDVEGKVAGIIDLDSSPGNLTDSNKYNTSTYEDDTGKAPNIRIILETRVRELNGYAWEDKRTVYNEANETNNGNGIRDNGEALINGVTVQLIERIDGQEDFIWKTFKTGSTQDLSAIFGLNINGKDYITINKSDISSGKYLFKSFIPGNYYVKFIYGDSYDTALTSKVNWCGNDVKGLNDNSYNGVDYRSTIYQAGNENNNSDAADVWERREVVTNYSKYLTNHYSEVLSIYKNKIFEDNNKNLELANELINNTSMQAITDNMDMEVEYKDIYTINNIDLGLVERPKSGLVLNKTVENVKIVLANGTILYDANGKMSHVLWDSAVNGHEVSKNKGIINNISLRNKKGLIQLTVDEEYMTGSTILITYKLTVTNVGENDYYEELYYKTGRVANANNITKTSARKVIDYVDNSLGFDASLNPGWQVVEKDGDSANTQTSRLLTQGLVTSRLQDEVNSYNNILVTEDLSKELKPGESVSKQLVLTKTLSSNEDVTSFTNNAEIVETSCTSGVNLKYSILGNQNPTLAPSELDSEDSDTVTLLTPFGEARRNYITAGIVVAALGIITAGIVIIRKKIISK